MLHGKARELLNTRGGEPVPPRRWEVGSGKWRKSKVSGN